MDRATQAPLGWRSLISNSHSPQLGPTVDSLEPTSFLALLNTTQEVFTKYYLLRTDPLPRPPLASRFSF